MPRMLALCLLFAVGPLAFACDSDDDVEPGASGKDGGSKDPTGPSRRDARVEPEDPRSDEVAQPQPSACALDPAACPECKADKDCAEDAPCYSGSCGDEGRCESTMRDDGSECVRGDDDAGVCVAGKCVECDEDADCSASESSPCEEAYCDPRGRCSLRTRVAGSACESGGFCSDDALCVTCATDANCGDHGHCVEEQCECDDGFVANTGAEPGCNPDECQRIDDNRCATPLADNACTNTDEGYSCKCDTAHGWKLGGSKNAPQCYLGGDGATFTVPNGATWNVWPSLSIACPMAYADPPPAGCPLGDDGKALHAQLNWLNLCSLGPPPCVALQGNDTGLLSATVLRVSYSAPLQDYGDPPELGGMKVDDLAVGDVILVQTLTADHMMRVQSIDGSQLVYEWATIWRDHCHEPGGATCTKSCGCEGGS